MGGFGNSFDQVVGIMTAGTEIMVGMPSQVARGWRTIGANILKVAQSSDTYTAASGKVNIATRKQNGEMKNTYEMMKDLYEGQKGVSKGWKELSKEEQSAIALELAGKQNMEKFRAVMDNFETAINATATAQNSAGSAMKENERYINSMQGSLQNLKSAWSEFSNAMMNGNLIKGVLNGLAKVLRFLASDAGKFVLLGTGIATTLNLIAKAALGLKGLSLVKLFSGLGGVLTGATKGAKGATDALKVMQDAQVGAAGGASKLAGAFMRVGGGLLGPVGLVAAIGLASVALAKYVDIGEKAQDIRVTKALKEAQSDVEKTETKYKALNDELDKLRQKQKDGTITDSESNRLAILENQTKQLERQLELKKEIAGNKADEYYHTVDPSKLEGKAKDRYTLAKSAGKSDKEALAAAGINDKIALSLNNVQARSEEVARAQQKVTEAYEHYGTESKQYKNAIEELGKAQDAQGDSLSQLEKKRQKAIKDYGSAEKANKKLGQSWKDLNKEIKALKTLKGLDLKSPLKNMDKLKQSAKTLGIEFNKSGTKIKSIDLSTFTTQMVSAGHSVEDTYNYLKELGQADPNIKVNIDGTEVAAKDLEFVDGKIQKMKKEKPKMKMEADTKDAKQKLDDLQKKYDKINGKGASVKLGTKVSNGGLLQFIKSIGSLKGKTVNVKATTSGKTGVDNLKKSISNLGGKTIDVITNLITRKKTVKEAHGVRHFAAGGQMVNAEVNEQGFEIIQDADTGLMRVVNGGKRGATYLGEGDSVFTHGQSVRMLRNAGLTEGDVIYGHGDEDFDLFGIKKLQGFKKGKKKKKKKKSGALSQKDYNKKYEAIQNAMNSDVATLEYQRDYYNWTAGQFAEAYKRAYEGRVAELNSLNQAKVKSGVSKKGDLGTEIVRAYNLAQQSARSEAAKKNIESLISNTQGTESDLANMLNAINAAGQSQLITADEAKEYRMRAYKQHVEYNLKQFQNNKDTYAKSLALIKDYYAQGKLSGEDYYKYLEQLAKDQLEKEKTRLSEQRTQLTNTYDLAKAYVQRQIALLQTENDEQKEQNELVKLQTNLAKARNQRVRIYKEGEGFVYEKDTEAIREATNALKEYQSSTTSSEEALNPVLVQWQNVLKLFDELEADYELKALENKVGATVGQLFGSLGTNTGAWSDWIKQNLSTTQGISDVLTNLDKLVDTNDIINYLDSNGQVSQAVIDAAIGNNVLPTTYAAAVTQMAQGMSAGVNTAANLATQSSITAATSGAVVMGNATQYGNIYNFDNLVLPNVTNANEFIDGLNNLSTTALQTSTQRG